MNVIFVTMAVFVACGFKSRLYYNSSAVPYGSVAAAAVILGAAAVAMQRIPTRADVTRHVTLTIPLTPIVSLVATEAAFGHGCSTCFL